MDKINNCIKGFIKKTPFFKHLKKFKVIYYNKQEYFLSVIDYFLPQDHFIQKIPDIVSALGYYPEFNQERKEYYLSTNRSKRDGNRLLLTKLLLDIAGNCKTGDYAELGSYQGSFAKIIYQHMNEDCQFYCFDTFEGFTQSDVEKEINVSGVKKAFGNFNDTSEELVIRNITGKNILSKEDRVILKKGYFPGTFKGLENMDWRFVHLDADLYEPIKKGIELFWPNIVPGGVLLIHDYLGGYKGVKIAVDEYFKPLGIVPVPLCDKSGSAVIIKNRN